MNTSLVIALLVGIVAYRLVMDLFRWRRDKRELLMTEIRSGRITYVDDKYFCVEYEIGGKMRSHTYPLTSANFLPVLNCDVKALVSLRMAPFAPTNIDHLLPELERISAELEKQRRSNV